MPNILDHPLRGIALTHSPSLLPASFQASAEQTSALLFDSDLPGSRSGTWLPYDSDASYQISKAVQLLLGPGVLQRHSNYPSHFQNPSSAIPREGRPSGAAT